MATRQHLFGGGLHRLALSLFVTLAMVLGMCPTAGIAEEVAMEPEGSEATNQKRVGEEPALQAQDVLSYDLWVGGAQVTSDKMSGQGWSFDATSNTLTLDGANITTGHKAKLPKDPNSFGFYGIYYTGADPLTIAVASDSTVDVSEADEGDVKTGIFCESSGLTITGAGKLTATGAAEGISGFGNVTIDKGVIDATGPNGAIIAREGDVVIINGSTVEANGSIDGTHVTINGGTVEARSDAWGILGAVSVTISGGAVTASASASNGNGINANGNNFVPGTVTITGGTVSATGGTEGCGIYTQECSDTQAPGAVTIDSGIASVTASGGKQAIEGTVTNAVAGMGWTDAAGTTGKAAIAVSEAGQTLSFKKVQFPTPVAEVVEKPEPTNPNYDGKAQALVTAGTVEGGTMQYSLDGKSYSNKIPTGTDAKAYTVWYKAIGDAQHADFGSQSVAANIAKADPKVTAPKARSLTYDSKAQELVETGSAEGGTMQYSLDGKTWSDKVPTGTEAKSYTVWYKVVGDANHNDTEAKSVDVTITKKDEPKPTPAAAIVPTLSGHVQNAGDVAGTPAGTGSSVGTTGQSLRLESFSIALPAGTDGSIEYRGHVQNVGWDGWVADGAECGSRGLSRRVEALQACLSGKVADTHSVWYRVHVENQGTMGWARDGQAAGTAGRSLRVESLEVQVLPKGEVPADYVAGQASYVGAATGRVHVQDQGWTASGPALSFGTTGKSRRLEAVRLSVPNQPVPGGIEYEVHAQNRGWMPAAANGALAGTTGQSRRLEAVRVRLTGELAGGFSVWYRVHSQNRGWLGWTCDGQDAGTSGLSLRAEAIDVQVLPQGQVPAGYDGSAAFVSR